MEVGYLEWSKALGPLTMREYLHRVIASSETGQWSREISRMLEGFLND